MKRVFPQRVPSRFFAAVTAVFSTVLPLTISAGPEGGEVVGGSGSITQSGNTTTINQATDRMAIDWQSFDVAVDERVNFIQPDSSSVSLNRILSNSGSQIHGRIDANGRVFLVNPNGVFFGKDSVINAGGILASGLSLDPEDFMNGDFAFSALEGTDGMVINAGLIHAATGGSVSLLGQQVQNDGMISAQLGAVNLAAGNEAIVTFDGNGLLGVQITESILQDEIGVDAAVINNGDITAEDGQILLSASASQNIFSQAVNAGDVRQATSVVIDEDGGFTLSAGANVVNTGAISVSGDTGGALVVLGENVTSSGQMHADAASGEQAGVVEVHSMDTALLTENAEVTANAEQGVGGSIAILGDKVGLLDASRVDASGAAGGGHVFVGGDYKGENLELRNASRTYIATDSDIFADALYEGNGGRVIVWADETAVFYGDISVTGGALHGDGGFVEVSGKENLEFDGIVDRTAINGDVGTLLLDPLDLWIWGSSLNNSELSDQQILFGDSSGSDFYITASAVESALESGDVVLQATRDVLIRSFIDAESGNSNNLTIYAGDHFYIWSGGGVDLKDGDLLMVAGSPDCGGSCQIDDSNNYSFWFVNSELTTTGSISIYAGQDVEIGESDTGTATNINGGTVTIRAGDDVLLQDDAQIQSGSGGIYISTLDTDLQTDGFTVAPGAATSGDLSIEGDVQSTSGGSITGDVVNFDLENVSGAQLDSNGGDINFAVSGTIDVRRSIISGGGDITFASDSNRAADFDSDRDNALLDSSDAAGGGDIRVYTTGNIEIGTMQAHDTDADDAATVTLTFDSSGGDITLGRDYDYDSDNADYVTNLVFDAGQDIAIAGRTIDNTASGPNLLNITLTAGNDITVDGGTNIWLTGGSFTADATNNLSYGSSGGSRAHLDTEGGNVTIDAGGSVQIFSTGGIETAGGNFTVGGSRVPTSFSYNDADAATGDIDTETNATDSESGNVTITSTGAVTLGGITTSNGDSCGGGSDPCGDLTITAGGDITQNSGSALVINGTTTFDAAGFNVQLEETSNDFAIVTVAGALDVILDEANNIEFSNVAVTGDDSEERFTIDAAGAITQTAATEIASNAGGAVNLSAGTTMTLVDVNTSTAGATSSGSVTLTGADVTVGIVDTSATGASANGGAIDVDVSSSFTVNGAVDASSDSGTGGVFEVDGDANDNTFTIASGASWTSDQNFTINGADGSDEFNFEAASITVVADGDAGVDTFDIDANVQGSIDGGSWNDIFNISSSVDATLLGNDGSDQFHVLASGINATVQAAETGTNNTDEIHGFDDPDNANTWTILASGTHTLENNGGTVTFEDVELIYGADSVEQPEGSGTYVGGVDVFNIQTDFDGSIYGGSAADTFNVTTATADITGDVNGNAGADIFNIDFAVTTATIYGGEDGDTFNIAADVVTVNGDDGGDTFTVTADIAGALDGGAGDDTFDLSNDVGGGITGGTGSDSFNLLANGIATSITAGESGNDPDDETDTITGFSDTSTENLWTINSAEGGQVVNGETVTFTEMEAILGSTVDDAGGDSDIFTLNDEFDGSIDAQGGNDSLSVTAEGDYTVSFTAAVGGITNVESIANNTGSAANYSLILATGGNSGTATYNTWTITASSTTANSGTIEEYDTDDALLNTITFTNFDSFTGNALPDTFDVTDSGAGGPYSIDALSGSDGADTFNIGIEVVSSIAGGDGDDTFDFSTGGSSSGTLTGGDADTRDVIIGQNVDSDFTLSTATAFAGSIAVDGGADYVADFQEIEELQGGSGTADEIIGRNQGNFWDIEATGNTVGDNDTASSATDLITFSNMELLTGNAGADYFRIDTAFADDINAAGGDDTFDFSGGGSSTGTINAGDEDSRDVLIGQNIDSDYVLSDATANAGSVAADGGANYVDDFQGVEELQGGSGTADELFGRDQNNYWDIEVAANTVGDNAASGSATDLITFTGMEELTGESNDDYFTISTAFAGDIDAAAGDDTFDFSGGGSSTGTIDGGAADTRDVLIGQSTSSDFTLSTATAFAGSVAVDGGADYVADFQGVEDLQGSGAADELIGRDQDNYWDITGSGNTVGDNETAGSATDLITFSGMEVLTGMTGIDFFTIDTAFDGTLTGATGSNTLDVNADTNTWTITGALDGEIDTSDAGTAANITFTDMQTIHGNASDELVGRSGQTNTWEITSANGGTVNSSTSGDTMTFTGMTTLTGSDGIDNFNLDNGSAFSGTLNGMANADVFTLENDVTVAANGGDGNDVFNVSVTLTGTLAGDANDDQLNVLANNIAIPSFNGGDDTDTVVGVDDLANANTWAVSAGTLTNAASANVVNYSNVETLTGGTGVDNFTVASAFNGTLNGMGNNDTFTLNASVTTVNGGDGEDDFTVTDGITTVINGDGDDDTLTGDAVTNTWILSTANAGTLNTTVSFTTMEELVGNTGTDTLTGINQNNDWQITGGNSGTVSLQGNTADLVTFSEMENVTGGTGNDIFTFGSSGDLTNVNGGTSGTDRIVARNVANTWRLGASSGSLEETSPVDVYITSFSEIDELYGSASFADEFLFSASVTYTIDAGASSGDVANYSSVLANIDITVGAGAIDGLVGIEQVVGNNDGRTNTTYESNLTLDSSLDANWEISDVSGGDGLNDGRITFGPNTVDFINFSGLSGGSGNDTFDLDATASGVFDFIHGGDNDVAGDTIVGRNTNTTWLIFENADGGAGNEYAFGQFSNLTGLDDGGDPAIPYVNNTDFEGIEVINASDANDTFTVDNFNESGAFAITLNAGDGTDIINLPDQNLAITLGDAVGGLGLTGVETITADENLTNSFTVTSLSSQTVTWDVTSANSGTVTTPDGTTTFNNFQTLIGGAGNDTFSINTNGEVDTLINGAGGTNTLEGKEVANRWNIGGTSTGSIDDMTGAADRYVGGFQNIDTLTGSDVGNDFVFDALGSFEGTLIGGTGTDSVQVAEMTDHDTLWLIDPTGTVDNRMQRADSADNSTVDSTATLQNIENLTGGDGTDKFIFSQNGTYTGTLEAGDGDDVVDLSNISGAVSATLGAAQIAGVDNAERVIGNGANSTLNGLGTGTNVWTVYEFDGADPDVRLDGADDGTLSNGSTSIEFVDFHYLQGSDTATDEFTLSTNGSVTGRMTGGGGAFVDQVTGANVSNDWYLTTALAGTVNGSAFSEIDAIVGGTDTDNLYGRVQENNWQINGDDAGYVQGMDASDRMVFSGEIENVFGRSDDDHFVFTTSGTLSGTLNASDSGDTTGDTLTMQSGTSDTVTWTINGLSSGLVATRLAGGFSNIDSVIGDAGSDNVTVNSTFSGTITTNAGVDTINLLADVTGDISTGAGNDVININNSAVDANVIAGGDSDTFALGHTDGSTWTIDGLDSGEVAATGTVTFSGVETVQGNSAQDRVSVTDDFNGIIQTLGGNDLVTLNNDVALGVETGTGDDVISIAATGLTTDINAGANDTDRIRVTHTSASDWTISGSSSVDGVTFSEIEEIEGNDAVDTVNVTTAIDTIITNGNADIITLGAAVTTVEAGDGNDDIRISVDGITVGDLDGGIGTDTLSMTHAGASTWDIDTVQTVDNVTFTDVEIAQGNNATDTFNVDVSFNQLNGGAGNDQFNLSANVTDLNAEDGADVIDILVDEITVDVDGGNDGSTDILTISHAGASDWTINGSNTVDNVAFAEIETVQGNGNVDTVNVTVDFGTIETNGGADVVTIGANVTSVQLGNGGDTVTVSATGITTNISGGGGTDTLISPARASGETNTWNITSSDDTLNTTVTFSTIENYHGNDANDHFIIEDGVSVAEIRGLSPLVASDSGSDTLEVLSAYNTSETWNIDADGQGGVTGRVTDFYDIENLTGGEGVDTFTFNTTSSAIAGLIDGGERAGSVYDADTNPTPIADGMTDVLNLTVIESGVVVELGPVATVSSNPQPSVADNVHAHNIEEIIAFDDGVRGDENQVEDDNWLVITHGNDYQWDVSAFNQGLTRELLFGTTTEMPNTVVNFYNFGSMQGGSGSEISNISENNNITGTYVLGDGRRNLIFDNIDPADLVVVDLDENLISVTGNGNTILRVAASETDLNVDNIWEINAENAGTFTVNDGSMDPFTLDFVAVNQLVGGTGTDSFTFVGGGNLVDGSIDGNGGTNTITATTANLDLVFGINEMATGLPVTASYPDNRTTVDAIATRVGIIDLLDISNLAANPATTVTLYSGSAGDYIWNISTGGNSLSNATQLLSFSDVDNVIGGDGNDTFNISQLGVVTDDYDGGSGTDIVNITTLTSAAQVSLDPLVTVDTDIQLSNVETLNASNVGHTLVGGSAQNDWSITDSDDGSVDYNNGAGAATLAFTNMSNLIGGAGIDVFSVTGDGAVSGLINGAGNNDRLDISTLAGDQTVSLDALISTDFNVTGVEDIDGNPATDNSLIAEGLSNTWTMSGTNGGSLDAGTYTVAFSGFANVMGGGLDDTFYFDREGSNDDQLTGILHGGGGTDIVNIDSLQDLDSVGLGSANLADLRLVSIEEVNATEPNSYQLRADNITNVWEISGTDAGTVGTTTFTGFGYLVGGTGNDVFILDRDGGATADDRISTMIDGGAEPGSGTATDTLDLAGLVEDVIVSLDTTYTADLYVQNFEVIGAAEGTSNTLVGEITDNTWDIDEQNGGELNNIDFVNFENLVGRNGIDTFSFTATGSVDGFVDGGDQPTGTRDAVDLSEIANATVIIGDTTNGFNNIEEYRGGGATSLLRAADLENTWTIDALNSGMIVDQTGATIAFSDFGILEGGTDEDHFTLNGGAVSGEIRARAGNDDLTVVVDGVTNGQVTFVGGDDTDDITVQGGVSGMTASYLADVDDNASLTYEVQGASLVSYSVDYSEVESVDDDVVASSLTVNDIGGQADMIALVNDSFQLNALASVDFTNKESLIVAAEQADETVIQGTLQVNNLFEVLNSGVSVFDENAQVQALSVSFNGNDYVGASTAPVRVNAENLSLQNVQGVVYIEEANDINIETLSNMSGLVDIQANGNIQDTGALSTTQALYLESVTGAITFDNTNNLTGEVHLSAAGNATLTNNASTTLGDVTVQSFDLNSAGNVSDNGVLNVTGVTTISNASSITLDNPNNDFGGLVINEASSVDVVDVNDINFEGTAVNEMTVTAAGDIATTGTVSAGDVSLNSSGAAVTVNNNITAENSIVLNGESVSVNGGLSVTANLRDDAVAITGRSGNANIMGPIDTTSAGGSGDVVVVGQQVSQTLGAAITATDVTYTAALGIDQASAIDATGDVILSADGGDIVMSDNAAISAFGVQLSASGDASLLAIDGDNLAISGTNVTNNADVDLVSGTSINAAGNYLLSGGNTLTVTNGDFLIDAGVLDIDGTIVLGNGDLTLASGTDTTLTGSLSATNVSLTAGDTVGMAGSAMVDGSESVTVVAQNDITLSTLTSTAGVVTVNSTAGSVDDNNGDAVNIVAMELFMDTDQGVASFSNQLNTEVSEITALNSNGGLYVSNSIPVTVNALISEGDVYIENDGTITLGVSETPFDRSALTSREMGGVVTSSYQTGTVTIVVNSGNLFGSGSADASRPDVTGDIVDVAIGGSFGGGGRPLVIYARTEMLLSAFGGIFPIWGFGDRPANGLTTTADLLDSTALGSVTDLLIDVESIEQIDPAVFSEVRNYSYDNISIRMPRDQLYEDQMEDEEEDEEDVDIIL